MVWQKFLPFSRLRGPQKVAEISKKTVLFKSKGPISENRSFFAENFGAHILDLFHSKNSVLDPKYRQVPDTRPFFLTTSKTLVSYLAEKW